VFHACPETVDQYFLIKQDAHIATEQFDAQTFDLFTLNKRLLKWDHIINYARINAFSNRSISFPSRLDVILHRFNWASFFKVNPLVFFYNLFHYIFNRFNSIIILTLGRKWLFPIVEPLLIGAFINDNEFEKKLLKFNPSIVVFPFQGTNPVTTLLLKTCRKHKIPVMLVVDNWDNMSSKTIIWKDPDFISVWSEQTAMHTAQIQGIKPEKIKIMGSARFDQLRESVDACKSNDIFAFQGAKEYILFLGDSAGFDEVSILNQLSHFIAKMHPELKIIYRPHPYIFKEKYTRANLPANIRIDSTFEAQYFGEKLAVGAMADVDTEVLGELIANAMLVCCGGSTSLLETLLHRKRTLFITSEVVFGQKKLKGRYIHHEKEHFNGVDRFKNSFIIKDDQFDIQIFKNLMEMDFDTYSQNQIHDDELILYYYAMTFNFKEQFWNFINSQDKKNNFSYA